MDNGCVFGSVSVLVRRTGGHLAKVSNLLHEAKTPSSRGLLGGARAWPRHSYGEPRAESEAAPPQERSEPSLERRESERLDIC